MRNSCKKIAALLLALAVITSGLVFPEKAFAEYADSGYDFLLDADKDTIVKLPNLISGGADVAGVTLTNGWHIAATTGNLYGFVVTNSGSLSGQIGYCIAPGVSIPGTNAYKVKSASYVAEVAAQNPLLTESQLSYLMSLVLGYGYNGKYDKNYQNDKAYYDTFGKIWATQVLVWEVVVGERDASFNHVQPTSGVGVVKDCIKSTNPIYSNFTANYAAIEAEVKKAFKSPSFAAEAEAKTSANTYKLSYANGKYTLTLTDSNAVLGSYTAVSSNSSVSVSVSGNTMTLTSSTPITADVKISMTRNIAHKSFVIAGKNGQDFATVKENGSGAWQSVMIPIAGSATKNAYFYLEPSPAEIALTKVSANTSCTTGNPNYSLAGAVYGVYTEGNTAGNTVNAATLVGKITTDANGKGSLVTGLTAGRTYYVKEITASKGYTLDSNVYAVAPEGTGDKAGKVTSTEAPVNDPIQIQITKESTETIGNPASLAGTQFTVKYYALNPATSYTAAQLAAMTATRTWVIEAKEATNGVKVIYRAVLRPEYLVSGSDKFYTNEEGEAILPIGYITIQETKAASGYIKDSGTIKVGGTTVSNNGQAIVGWIDANGDMNPTSLKVSNEYTATNAPVYGGFKVGKFDAETKKAITGSETSFALYNRSGFSVKVGGKEYANNALIANLKTTNGVYASAADYLPYGSYELKETAAPAQYTMSGRTSVTFKIESNGTVVDLNSYAKGFTDTVIKGGFKIGKFDAETQKTITASETSFSLYNRSGKTVVVGGKEYANNAVIANLKTANGVYTSAANYLPYGSYELVETKAPAQYTMNGRTSVIFKIESNGTVVNLNSYAKGFTDIVIKGGFKIGKYDAGTQKAITTAETSFSLYNRSGKTVIVGGKEYANNAVIANLKTSKGVYTSAADYLPYGSYELVETAAPTGYILSGRTNVTFKIDTDGNIVNLNSYGKGFTDTEITGGFTIGKFDAETQKPVTEFETNFNLYNRSGKAVLVDSKEVADGAVIASLTTTNGVYTSEANYLPYGSYELVETAAPEGYLLQGRTSVTFKIETNAEIVDLNSYAKGFADTKIKGGFKLGKFDVETKEPITESETGFDLYNRSGKAVLVGGTEFADGAVIASLTTTKGVFESAADYLPYGSYEIVETSAPTGFILSGRTSVSFGITENGVVVDLANYETGLTDGHARGIVKVTKEAEDNVIEGIKFHLFGTSILGEEVDMTATTGADGVAVFENVPICGEEPYTLEEVDTPYRYKIVEAQNVEVVAGETAEFTFVNELKKGQIEVFKTGEVFTSVTEEGGNYRAVFEEGKLKNAVFEIRAAEDIILADGTVTYKQGDVVETITTGEDGIAKSKELDFGKYELEEVQAPAGFMRETEIFEIELTPADTDVSIATKSISNARQKIDLSILKAMEEDDTFKLGTNGELLNVKFALYAAEELIANDGSKIPKDGLLEEVSVSEDGTAKFSADLPLGKYYVKELATDEHYILTEDTYEFEFAPGDPDIETIEIVLNGGKPVVNELIRGSVKGKKLTDDGDELAGAEFGLFEEESEDPILTSVSDENGVFEFKDLPYGSYTVKETKAPEGYLLDEKEHLVEIGEDEALIEIEMVNPLIRGRIEGVKKGDDGKLLAGVSFGLYQDGQQIAIAVSDKDGKFVFENVPYGEYTVKEIESINGYLLSSKEFEVTISENGQLVEIEAVNKLIRGNLKLVKVDAENPEVKLSGAVFEVYKDANEDKALDESDEYIGPLQETEEGVYTMEDLPYGGYLVKEAKAPRYFKADENIYSAVIENDGETVIVANTQDGLFENEYLIGIMELMPPEIDRSFHGGAEISPLTGGNMNMYVLFAAGLLGIIAALFAGKNLRKSLSFVLVLCIAFGAAAPCFAAEEELKTVEVTIESYKKDDRDAVKAALEELGCKDFEIKEIKFETVSETVGVVKTEVIKGLSSKEAAKEYLEKDGLAADFEEIEFTEKYRTPASGYYDTAVGADVPKTRTVPIRQNGESFNVKLYLQSSEDMETTEIRDASYTAYFRGNGIRKYAFGDKIVDLDGNTPCFPGYEALIMEYFGLNPEKDTITGGSWGEAGEDYKTAVYTGTSEVVVPFVRSYYAEDENNPDRPHPVSYDAEIRYTNGVEEGKTKYTIKGTVTYINYPGTGTAAKIAQEEGFFTGKRLIILAVILALLGIFFTIGRKKEQK